MPKDNTNSPSTELQKYEESLPSDEAVENTLLRSQYIRFLDAPDDYSDLFFSPTEAQFIRRKLAHLSTGAFASIPLICRGSLCPWCERCPFWMIGKAPENRPCLVEINLLKEWTISFLKEYGVHPESMTDRIYVQEMAEIELLLYRINNNLAKLQYGELVAESVSNVTPQGNIIFEEKVIPLMDLKLRLQGRRDRVVKLMVGDRQEKYKRQAALKQADQSDASSKTASMKQKLDKLQRQVAIVGAKILSSKDGILTDISKDKEQENLDRQLTETVEIGREEEAREEEREAVKEVAEEVVEEEEMTAENVIDMFLENENLLSGNESDD